MFCVCPSIRRCVVNVRKELIRSLKRRGMPVPRNLYEPLEEPYKRPKPIDPEKPKRVVLTPADRAAIREMADAGVPWSEIEERFPNQTPRHLRAVGRGRRTAVCTGCGIDVKTEKPVDAVVVCSRCIQSMNLQCKDCGKPVSMGRERCTKCRKEREREDSRARMRAIRERQREEAA